MTELDKRAVALAPAVRRFGLDAADLDMLIRGDMLGSAGTKVFEALSQLQAHRGGQHFSIEHDGFTGTVIGSYERLDGYRGVVMQQDGTRVVHVYGEKHLRPAISSPHNTPTPAAMGIEQAKASGFTGSIRTSCGSMQMARKGTCETCQSCGSTTGCS